MASLSQTVEAAARRLTLPHDILQSGAGPLELRPPLAQPTYTVRVGRAALGYRVTLRSAQLASVFAASVFSSTSDWPDMRKHVEHDLPAGTTMLEWVVENNRFSVEILLPPAQSGRAAEHLGSAIEALLGIVRTVVSFFPPIGVPAAKRALKPVQGGPELWEVDPSERDRSTVDHRECENVLIDWLVSKGVVPLDPAGGVEFDLAWERSDGRMVVCEVKSLSANPVHQLRLGIGQVTEYATRLAGMFPDRPDWVRVVCISENPPDAALWKAVSERAGVNLVWPSRLDTEADVLIGPRAEVTYEFQ